MDQELLERIDLIERMVLQGRRTTQYWGWSFVLWGTGQLTAMGLSTLSWRPSLVWAVAMGACGILTAVISARQRRAEKAETLVSRAIMALWISFGVSVALLGFLGHPAGLFSLRSFSAVFLALMGFTNAASGLILRWPLQIGLGIAWWTSAVVIMFGPEKIIGWTLIAMVFLGEVVFGLYLMARERADRKHA
ncbi:MAG TPA: hypothetical protein VEW69_10110 [Alphaproteobacteria bacterium]|nr:hypothetical protein [Alphaproteobacteria bacterium]